MVDGVMISQSVAELDGLARARADQLLQSKAEELAAMVSLLETAQEVGKVGTFVAWLTPDKVNVDVWSKTCMEIFGYDETTYDGTNDAFWRRVHPDDVEMVRTAQAVAHRHDGSHYDVRHRIVRLDGEVRWIRERAKVERDSEGNPLRFLGVTLDITEERVAEEALRASEARFRSAFDSSGIGMALTVDGVLIQANDALAAMLGRTRSEIVGHPYTDFAKPEDLKAEEPEIRRLIAGAKDLHTFEHRFIHADGQTIWGRVHISVVRDSGGGPQSTLAQIEDITDAKRTHDELVKSRLEGEMKSRLVSMLSHEVRTPLNSILGFTELLQAEKAGPLTDKQKRYVDNVDQSGRHLLELVSDHLDLAKLDAGRMEVKVVSFDARSLLDQVMSQMTPLADSHGLELRLASPGSITVVADRRRLLQVLLNLLSNSLKNTPGGGVITVSARESGAQVEIAVTDTGRGIPADQLERIFEEYSQVGAQTEGTGLGLPVSRRLARLMGGDLLVQSEPGAGSTFTIRLATAAPVLVEAFWPNLSPISRPNPAAA